MYFKREQDYDSPLLLFVTIQLKWSPNAMISDKFVFNNWSIPDHPPPWDPHTNLKLFIVAYYLYKGSCFQWLEDMWRACVKSGLPIIHSNPIINNCKSFLSHNYPRYTTELFLRVGRDNRFMCQPA